MNSRLLGAKILQSLHQDGFRATLHKSFVNLTRRPLQDEFDLQRGTDTGAPVPLWKLKRTPPNARFGTKYQATSVQEFAEAISVIPESLDTFTFIDLGCGKGRALLLAAEWGFKQVIGVEFSRELADIARKNLAKMGLTNVVVMDADAGEFQFPEKDIVVYLYHPFSEDVTRKAVVNLQACRARRLYVVYLNPRCADVFDSSGFLTRFRSSLSNRYIVWQATAK